MLVFYKLQSDQSINTDVIQLNVFRSSEQRCQQKKSSDDRDRIGASVAFLKNNLLSLIVCKWIDFKLQPKSMLQII